MYTYILFSIYYFKKQAKQMTRAYFFVKHLSTVKNCKKMQKVD